MTMWRPRLSRLLPPRSLHNPRHRTPPVVEVRSMDPRFGPRRHADFRICSVSGFKTEVLELRARNPSVCVLVIPGNPGVVSFYRDFVEAIYEMLDENASVIAVGHIGHTQKIDFVNQELQSTRTPIVLVGHSIGAYISLQIFKQISSQVQFTIGLYPFLTLNKKSLQQSIIRIITRSAVLSTFLSTTAAVLGLIPSFASKVLVRISMGKQWSTTAVEATCSHLLQYNAVRNMCFMAMTEFEKFSEEGDWEFVREKQDQIAFLFGTDDHWGPLSLFEEISGHVPNVSLSIEREGHKHAFCCTKAGSVWAAQFVATRVKH
ncbi:uncharacterized protein LOC116253756 isoform X2 [Nymphaea colorata]|uniref:uncharacterized protein LOC116253756 isoform X2 n=1 Tax=Nymphaea colorata TaxID=210225 RepID=UPI00129E6A67|nr:uncharacterized protein LOC116253756 isoform X2 [Nymphaea colorata]